MKFQCDQCQRRYDPTTTNFIPPIAHRHFCTHACREVWLEKWESLYGTSALPESRRKTAKEQEEDEMDAQLAFSFSATKVDP
jgi:endogenous inhibitor of DNA gyrase (YacG/DUF329 family)